MPPSPALRFSPGREPKTVSHKRGRSLEGGLLYREKDDDLALFNEMQSRESENFLLQSSDTVEDPFSVKLRHFSDIKLGISVPDRGESSGLLNADGDKNDYDWLLTPPDTPLFPSLDEDEPPPINVPSRGRPQSKPISISRSSTMERSRRSSRGSASPNRLSPSPRTGNSTSQSRAGPSSVSNSSPTQNLRHATPSRRPSTPPNKPSTPAPRSSTPTPRRMSTGSNGPVSGIRGTSPVKTSRGNSASPKIRAWQTNIPGFSSEAPPNLRTSLADRPASYVRGSSPASRNGKDPTTRYSRQSMSPTASRSSSSFHSHDRDRFSSRSKGSIASSGDDDTDSIQSIQVGSLDRLSSRRSSSVINNRTPAISKKTAKTVSPNSAPKRSFDPALRQMDRKSPQNMFRPLLSSVPSTTFYVGKANSARNNSLVSRNSSITTSSNASSDQGTSIALDTEGSDHNQDDVASEAEKIPYPDIHEEVFAFDKDDVMNADTGHEIANESVDAHLNESKGSKIDCGPTIAEESLYHGIAAATIESSETTNAKTDIMETDGFENTAICSQCGCRYEASDQTEKDVRLCPECSGKYTMVRVIPQETVLAVAEDSSMFSTNGSTEEKPGAETDQLMVSCELPQDTNVDGERGAERSQSEVIQDQSQQIPPPSSAAEGSGQMPANQLDMDQSGADGRNPSSNVGDQQLYQHNDRRNSKMDLLGGAGISVLLKRSSSSKGPVVQGRTFTATTISYDDISLARGSANSFRSSTGHGSYSASSSVDFSPAKKMDSGMQRQLSSRKLDVDGGHDIRIKHERSGSSFSGTSSHSHRGVGLATQETEYDTTEEMPVISEVKVAEYLVTDVIDASPTGSTVEENNVRYHDGAAGACNSELLGQAVGVQPDSSSLASFRNHGACSDENVEDHSNDGRILSIVEAAVMVPVLSVDEESDVQCANLDGSDALPATKILTSTESEAEREISCQNNPGVGEDDPSQISKCTVDDCQESSIPNPSDAPFPESNASECSHGIEESTVTVECPGGGNPRSLTLEEATDAILFCSSIVHDLAYQAATIAMEKASSEPLEGSKPMVTIPDAPKAGGRKGLRNRAVGKHTLKSQKARERKVETDVKSPCGETEKDEVVDESFKHNAGLPNKVDSMKPPKIESKCNCTIM